MRRDNSCQGGNGVFFMAGWLVATGGAVLRGHSKSTLYHDDLFSLSLSLSAEQFSLSRNQLPFPFFPLFFPLIRTK